MSDKRIPIVQDYLNKNNIDAYVMSDYENRNPTMVSFLGDKMLTRKIFLIFKKEGLPVVILHSIDSNFFRGEEKDYDLHVYHTWEEMLEEEKKVLSDCQKVLMDMSENGLLPRVSLADYGTVSYIKGLGKKVVSSGDLLEMFSAAYDEKAYEGQLLACKKALQIKDEAFALIKEDILKNGVSDEYRIQQFICRRFHEEGMVYDDAAIVAKNAYASNPHYAPSEKEHHPLKEGDVVLIDMWAKLDRPDGVYADITWMGYIGKKVPEKVEARFQILRKAVDSAFAFLEENLPHRRVEGYEVDDVARKVVTDAGYGEYFTHRTGHNIAIDVSPHGPGVNMDDYESHDTRAIIPHISFSLEPGIYAPDFGMRSETDVYIDGERKPHMVAGRQEHVIAILADK